LLFRFSQLDGLLTQAAKVGHLPGELLYGIWATFLEDNMTILMVILAAGMGIIWSVADRCATHLSRMRGRRAGLVCWISAVAVPMLVSLFLLTKVTLVSMVISTVLSYIAHKKFPVMGQPVRYGSGILEPDVDDFDN
jgi:hypothetical protein